MNNTDELIDQSNDFCKDGHYGEVINLLKDEVILAADNDANKAKLYVNRGVARFYSKDTDNAISDYSAALDLLPGYELALKNRGLAYREKKDYDKAITDFETILNISPNDADAYCDIGVIYHDKQDNKKAIEYYSKCIDADPKHILALENRAKAWRKENANDKALTDLTTILDLEPRNANIFERRGNVYLDINEYDKAIEDFDKAIEIDRSYADAFCDKGVAYYYKKDLDRAIEEYTKAIDIKPGFVLALSNRANAFVEQKKYEDAIRDYTTILDAGPDNSIFKSRGNAYIDIKNYDEALDDFGKILETEPNNTEAFYSSAYIWYQLKNIDKAFEAYNKILGIDDNDSGAYNGRGVMYYERKDFDAALKDFNRSIDIFKSDALAYNNRCILYYDTGKYCECLNDYREAIRINKDDVEEYKYVSLLNNFYTEIGEEIKTEVKDKILAVFGKMMAEIIYNIRQIALDHDGKQIAHYTKLNVADLMIYDQADQPAKGKKLRYYNAVYMNDPQEGMILLEYLKSIAGAQYETIEAAFNTGKVDDNNVYLGSFLPEDHKDDLVMWRTYGKDEKGVEGGGCSIVIDTDFFDASDVNESLQQLSFSANRQASATKVTRQPLYRVLYYNRRKNEFITDINEKSKKDNDDLKKHLKLLVDEIISLLTFKEAEQSPINSTIDKIIYYALSELRYFFKSADYSFENEYRVIVNAKSTDDTVKVDEGSTPRRLYIESNKHIQNVASGEEKKNYIKEVTLGPKVPNPERWLYLDASMKKKGFNDFQLKRSECRYQ